MHVGLAFIWPIKPESDQLSTTRRFVVYTEQWISAEMTVKRIKTTAYFVENGKKKKKKKTVLVSPKRSFSN